MTREALRSTQAPPKERYREHPVAVHLTACAIAG